MSIARFSIKHKTCVLLAVILLSCFGVMSLTGLDMSLMPDMDAPAAMVMTVYAGASPSDIEELVTDPLESAIMSISGVDEVESSSADNVSTVTITYEDDVDVDIAATKLREAFDLVDLPDGCNDPIIVNIDVNALMPTAVVALAGSDLAELQNLAEDVVSPALSRLDGVASVDVTGGVEQEISVEVDSSRASGLGISNSYIAQFLAAENLLYPAGDMNNGSKELTVSTDAKFRSVDDVANMLITLPTGGAIRLSEVADVRLKDVDQQGKGTLNREPCVILQVSKQSGANEVAVSQAVEQRMAEVAADYPGLVYSVPYSGAEFILEVVDSALQNIVQGVILAAVVVFLFLRRWGATATISVSMPVCILTTFSVMQICDVSMNIMSLGGIAMGVGMIVDNSIVVLDNIYRFAGEGHSRMESCVEGAKEVTTSVVASTATTVAVFVPLALADGMAGMMFRDFCLTIAFLVLASLFISLTLVPLLCYFMLDEGRAHQRQMKKAAARQQKKKKRANPLMAAYKAILGFFSRHLAIGMLAAFAMVALLVLPCLSSTVVLMPDMDQSQMTISIETPIGSQLEETAAIADRVCAIVEESVPELEEMYSIAQPESATVMVNLVDKDQRERSSADVADDLRWELRDIAGCEITTSTSLISIISGDDISVDISGDDYETLTAIADDLAGQISGLEDAVNVTSSASELVPEVKITMKRENAAQYGLTAAGVGSAVRAELTGIEASTVTIDNTEYDIMVRGDGAAQESLDALRSLSIATSYGGAVPLSAVADVEIVQAPQTITRLDQTRTVSITGETVSGDTTAMNRQIAAILDAYPMPEGYSAEISGTSDSMDEMYGDLAQVLIIAAALVYFVLAVQFESFLMPLVVMMIIPVAFAGALCALPLTGRDISIVSMVALIMLAGTVVNNSIVLIEYIHIRREMGETRVEAILSACPTRVRPIMMTTLTTVLAMVPMALGLGGSNEMMSDMGVCMIGGMVISTLNTLVFTPVYYSVLDNLGRLFRRNRSGQDAPAAGA